MATVTSDGYGFQGTVQSACRTPRVPTSNSLSNDLRMIIHRASGRCGPSSHAHRERDGGTRNADGVHVLVSRLGVGGSSRNVGIADSLVRDSGELELVGGLQVGIAGGAIDGGEILKIEHESEHPQQLEQFPVPSGPLPGARPI